MEQSQRRYRGAKDYVLREDITDPNLLRDGERLRIPMMMADGTSAPHDRRPLLAHHQPGHYRPQDQAMLDAKEQAYRERAHDDENAWRTPLVDTAPPDPAVTEATRGTPSPTDALAMMDERERAYRDYDLEAANAWRSKG